MKSICIVPIYNEFDELQNLINKIQKISQNNDDIDFLLVDNGSNDGSSKIIENSDNRLNDYLKKGFYKINFFCIGYYNVSIIPKTVTAETAATLKAKFRFLSIFFS